MGSAKVMAKCVQRGQKSITKYGKAGIALIEGEKFTPYSIFAGANLSRGTIP